MLVEVGRSPTIASTSISIFSLGGIIAALGVGLLIDRFGATKVLVTFLLLATAMLFLIGRVLESASDSMLLTLLGIGGFFFLGAYGGVNVILASFYPHKIRALGIGWAKSIGRVGTIIAPVIIGFGLDAGFPETWIMSLFSVPAAVAALTLLVIAFSGSNTKPAQGDEAPQAG
jgi:MFS family permease